MKSLKKKDKRVVLNKSAMIAGVSEKLGVTAKDTEMVVDALLGLMEESLLNGNTVTFVGIVSLKPVFKPAGTVTVGTRTVEAEKRIRVRSTTSAALDEKYRKLDKN